MGEDEKGFKRQEWFFLRVKQRATDRAGRSL